MKKIPSQSRSREQVKKIIRVADRIIVRDGYRSFSTNKLAREAGIGIATIYDYFSNKEEILWAVLELELEETMRALEERLPVALAAQAEDGLRDLLRFVLNEVVRKSEYIRTIAGELHGASEFPATVRFFSQGEMLVRLLLATYTRKAVAEVQLDAYLLTHGIAGICLALAHGLPPDTTIDDVAEHLMLRVNTALVQS